MLSMTINILAGGVIVRFRAIPGLKKKMSDYLNLQAELITGHTEFALREANIHTPKAKNADIEFVFFIAFHS